MESTSLEIRLESIRSLQSTIRKSGKAMAQMTAKGASLTLISKRLKAVQIGLAALEALWDHTPFSYTNEDLIQARQILVGLLPTLETHLLTYEDVSPQRTLLERRIFAHELAVSAIDTIVNSI